MNMMRWASRNRRTAMHAFDPAAGESLFVGLETLEPRLLLSAAGPMATPTLERFADLAHPFAQHQRSEHGHGARMVDAGRWRPCR
jgi:hypothetical protein